MNDQEMLLSICKTTEMGVDSIKDLLQYIKEPEIRKAMREQKEEYDTIYANAYSMLSARGLQPKDVSQMAKTGASIAIRTETMGNRTASKAAQLLIKGNTTGMTKSIKNIKRYNGNDEQVRLLATRLLRTEQANIEQMKSFL